MAEVAGAWYRGFARVQLRWLPDPQYIARFQLAPEQAVALEGTDRWEPGKSFELIIDVSQFDDRVPLQFDARLKSTATVEYAEQQRDLFDGWAFTGGALLAAPLILEDPAPPDGTATLRLTVPNWFVPLPDARRIQKAQEPSKGLASTERRAATSASFGSWSVVVESLQLWNLMEWWARQFDDDDDDGTESPRPWFDPPLRQSVASHVMEIRNTHEPVLTRSMVNQWIRTAGCFASLTRGAWSFPLRADELDEAGVIRRTTWFDPQIHPTSVLDSWWPRSGASTDQISRMIETIWTLTDEGDDTESFTLALNWYISALASDDPRSQLVLSQAALELLAWVDLVVDGAMSPDGFSNLPAADKIRLLLQRREVSIELPPALTNLRPRNPKEPQPDGVQVVVNMRNNCIHPPRSRQGHLRSEAAERDAAQLAVRHLEQVLIAIAGWRGPRHDRITDRTTSHG